MKGGPGLNSRRAEEHANKVSPVLEEVLVWGIGPCLEA